VSQDIKREAVQTPPFKTLARQAYDFVGKTVVLGGYIIETRYERGRTSMEILQAPLTFLDEPRTRDLSQGRIIVRHEGYLDPEVYRKDRVVTVAGTLRRCEIRNVETCEVESREIYLWPEKEEVYYPYYYWGHPYYWDPFYYPRRCRICW
jgi:outer membrane lipoprotein